MMRDTPGTLGSRGLGDLTPIDGVVRAYPPSFLPVGSVVPRHAGEAWRENVAELLRGGVVRGATVDHPPLHPSMAAIVSRILEGDAQNFSPEIRENPAIQREFAQTAGELFGTLDAVHGVLWILGGLALALYLVD